MATVLLLLVLTACTSPEVPSAESLNVPDSLFARAATNGRAANEAFVRSHRLVEAWLDHADPDTGLLPRNLTNSNYWNAQDAAADLYPFLVLTTSFADRSLFEGRMQEILLTEAALTSRLGQLPDTYSFTKRGFRDETADLDEILFGTSEYIKDGLMPLTEWLGASPWRARMLGMLDSMWRRAPVETPHGAIVSTDPEVNGEMLQVLTRTYWMTEEKKYLDYAVRLGDYYLLGGHHPTRDMDRLRLRDHGNEIVSGLAGLYATLHHARPEKADAYRTPIHTMLDRVLEVGRDEHGLFYNVVNPQTGDVLDSGIADTFGYVLNGFYTVYRIDGTEAYRQAVRTALGALENHYADYNWESGSADGDADAIEGALNLYNREPVPSTRDWIDRQTRFMWSKQDSAHRPNTEAWRGNGIVEGWHGDGNFARTSIMYALWKTQGTSVHPWRDDVIVGAVQTKDRLVVHLSAEEAWTGTLHFDEPRHRTQMGLPLDWPRINQFPEWFTVTADRRYAVLDVSDGTRSTYSGEQLLHGIRVRLTAGDERRLVVRPL